MLTVSLPAILDLVAAANLADELRATTGPVTVDASAVERVGIPGLQCLLSAERSGRHAISVEAPSDALRAAARTAGIDFRFSAQV